MYDWLNAALASQSACVLTANRRLAKTLKDDFAAQQIAAGRSAWRSPAVFAWRDWIAVLVDGLNDASRLPLRINDLQSRVLWERCLRQDLDDPFINHANLARQCKDTWQRLHEWSVPLAQVQESAQGQDQRIFARAAQRYAQLLDENHWIDNARLPGLLVDLVATGELAAPKLVTACGFDRMTPQSETLLAAMVSAGTALHSQPLDAAGAASVQSYPNNEAELRAAGRWARGQLNDNPALSIAIVVSKLEQDADGLAALLREGLMPGWQYAAPGYAAALNVSYGRRFADYPAISAALVALRWLFQPLRSADISVLLRSPFFGQAPATGRSLLELRMRDWPDRDWTRALFLQSVDAREAAPDCSAFIEQLTRAGKLLDSKPVMQRPADWAELLDKVLTELGWPGSAPLNSLDFQLDNRWRDLLNEFARLELVSPKISGGEALSRLAGLAGETLFQAEGEQAVVQVLGPLEAAGLRFDKLWASGLTAADWPGPGRPLPLLSHELQSRYAMPDATPEDTADFATRTLQRIRCSADEVIFSFAEIIGDAEQLPSALLKDVGRQAAQADPGWHASALLDPHALECIDDRVPAVGADEVLAGGAGTIQRQGEEPFSAFAYGRLGIRWLAAFNPGIGPSLRGSLIHDALHRLYAARPSQRDIAAWSHGELERRCGKAVAATFARHVQSADKMLGELLELEKLRTARLLLDVVAIDRERSEFVVDAAESDIAAQFGALRLHLRCDRIDRLADDSLVILDYKTGARKKFLVAGEPRDLQLVVYACALSQAISGLGLFNVDARESGIEGAGPAFDDADNWDGKLERWTGVVLQLAQQIAEGDVRINVRRGLTEARPLALLSRYAEVYRGN